MAVSVASHSSSCALLFSSHCVHRRCHRQQSLARLVTGSSKGRSSMAVVLKGERWQQHLAGSVGDGMW